MNLTGRWKSDNQMFYRMFLRERVVPMMLGGIVGDALGVPVEFKQRDTFSIKGMTGYGAHDQPIGTWSDDTSLTLCLVENIMGNGDQKGLLDIFVKYVMEGHLTPFGKVFDIGMTTRSAIERYISGVLPDICGGNETYDNGNGALMRISPLVPFLYRDLDVISKINYIESICSVTHRHSCSHLACIFYIQFLIMIMNNNNKVEAYNGAVNICSNYYVKEKYVNEYHHFKRILQNRIYNYNREQIYSDGYVVHTLEAALWCFFKHNNYKAVVLEAVNLGGDTDTIASIAGTIAGLYYKMEGIPSEWVNALRNKEGIKEILLQFCEYLVDKEYS